MKFSIRLISLVAFTLWIHSSAFAETKKPKYGPTFENPFASILSLDHGYFQNPKNKAPDFWGMIPYHRPQLAGPDCSAISVTIALNAARRAMFKSSDDKLITPKELVKSVKVDHWYERIYSKGYKGESGTTLDTLQTVTQESFVKNGFPQTKTTLHRYEDTSSFKAELEKNLIENESNDEDYIIANFDEGVYIADGGSYAHISPVAAYDKENKKVLVLDVAGDWYEPYWVSLDLFMKGLNTQDSYKKQNRGYIYIQTTQKK